MNFKEFRHILDLKLFLPTLYEDKRGYFYESFNKKIFETITKIKTEFVQDNHSKSQKGVLRGMHYQLPPFEQGKLVRVVKGKVFDVALDIRKSSPSFGRWVGVELSSENKHQFWIPPGFAHGFLALTDDVEFLYKTTKYYSKSHERSILWNDEKRY